MSTLLTLPREGVQVVLDGDQRGQVITLLHHQRVEVGADGAVGVELADVLGSGYARSLIARCSLTNRLAMVDDRDTRADFQRLDGPVAVVPVQHANDFGLV